MDAKGFSKVFLAVVTAAVMLPPGGAARAEEVHFPDPNLEAAVREELGIPSPTPVTDADMLNIHGFDPSARDISDLTGMEYAGNLNWLSAMTNQITDVSPLSELDSLVVLYLGWNHVTDITPLGGLPNLGGLQWTANQISDISGVSDLTALHWVNMSQNQISDISPLAGCTNLYLLTLTDNEIGDISALANLPALNCVFLADNQISDISPLTELFELDELDLRGNPLDEEAYSTYIPLIEANNPGIEIYYDAIPEPGALAMLLLMSGLVGLRRRKLVRL